MAFSLSDRSLSRLRGVHPDLVKVVKSAIDFTDGVEVMVRSNSIASLNGAAAVNWFQIVQQP